MCQSIKKEENTILVGYNPFSNRLQGWNLDKNQAEFEIQLQTEGPDGIPEVVSFYYHSRDSVFILSFFSLSLIRSDGSTVWRHLLNNSKSQINGDNAEHAKLWCNSDHTSPIFYDADENALYAAFKPLKFFESGRSEQPLCGKLNLDDLTLEPLPIYLPKKYLMEYYPYYDQINMRFTEDEILYAFYHNPSIYRFDKKAKKTAVFDLQSKFAGQLAPPVSSTVQEGSPELTEYIGEYPLFFKINSDGQHFYRVHVSALTMDSMSPKRKKYLMVFDKNLNLLSDFELPDGLGAMGSNVPVDEGMIFYKLHSESEDINEYLKVKLACII